MTTLYFVHYAGPVLKLVLFIAFMAIFYHLVKGCNEPAKKMAIPFLFITTEKQWIILSGIPALGIVFIIGLMWILSRGRGTGYYIDRKEQDPLNKLNN